MRTLVLLACTALACGGCRNESTIMSIPLFPDTTAPVPFRQLVSVAGDSQRGVVGSRVAVPLQVAIRDSVGHGGAGIRVQFAVIGTGAALTPPTGIVRTDSTGHASVTVTFGRSAGAVRVVAASADAAGSATFDLVATPSPALTLGTLSGDSQVVALPGSTLEPFVVAVRDTFGNRVSTRPAVVFRVTGTGASFGGQDSLAVIADTAGTAPAALTSPAPADGDTVRVTASFAGMAKPPLRALVVGLAFRGKTWGAYGSRVCALTTAGAAYCWGDGSYGALGTGGTSSRNAPTPVTTAFSFVAVDPGGGAGCGLTSGGAAACWGTNAYGATGGGNVAFRSVGATSGAACGVSASGALHCWGSSPLPYGTSHMIVPSPVPLTQVSAGGSVACALSADGRAFCWGDNSSGQLGTGNTTASTAAALPVAGGLTFGAISVGGSHVCGLATSGAAYCWGSGSYGQLGTGAATNAPTPVLVPAGLTFSDISAGTYHTCAVTSAGAAYCWGPNGDGRLGTGTTTSSTVPVAVVGGITFASISAGTDFTCGVAVGGAMYCWGSNTYGALGIGSTVTTPVLTPTAVAGGLVFRP